MGDQEQAGGNFTGFDSSNVARPARVAPSGGGGQSEKHRANRSNLSDLATTKEGQGGSGIVGGSGSGGGGVDETGLSSSGQLAKYGAFGIKRSKHAQPPAGGGHSTNTSSPSKSAPTASAGGAAPSVVHLNSEKAQDLEKRMLADAAKAAEKAQAEGDAFDSAYEAIAQVQPTAATTPNATAGGSVQDDDFDF